MTEFQLDVFQNEYLPDGGTTVDAIVTVTARGGHAGIPTETAVVILVDTSGSMSADNRLHEAKRATAVAIDSLPDGVYFAVVAGDNRAAMVYPRDYRLARANPRNRADAQKAVGRLVANGGTAIGQWLRLADQLLAGHPGSIRHAILLTDGENQHETPQDLDAVLAACAGRFTCDCRGVGTDWKVAELRRISTALLGTVDIVADPRGLAADFAAMTTTAMGKGVGTAALRVWTPQGATVRFVKQTLPTVQDLTARRTVVGPLVGDYPTGSWGQESRDYHVCVEVKAAGVGDEMLAARVSLVVGDQVVSQGLVRAVWTDDLGLSTRINPQVAHYTGQAELSRAIQDGLAARREGDMDTATSRLGRAVALATESGNDTITTLLRKVVDIEDPATGRVRLRARIADADEMALDTRSTRTVRAVRAANP
ncbi:VWA domain-containing protein [Longispora sp. K20-0274]|uniref:vWA domain-containing protein n=1 Tax=Longispora sp. K20-0274 TaxID=3088255 RepID=UPI0039998214